jgi:hypothetical protein
MSAVVRSGHTPPDAIGSVRPFAVIRRDRPGLSAAEKQRSSMFSELPGATTIIVAPHTGFLFKNLFHFFLKRPISQLVLLFFEFG